MLVAILFNLLTVLTASARDDREFRVKSAFLEKIPRFVTWPGSDGKEFFTIGVAGKSRFPEVLKAYCSTLTIKEKKIRIISIPGPEQLDKCDLLFVCASEKKRIRDYLRFAKDKQILVAGDTKGFAETGVHINLIKKRGKIRLQINRNSMKESGFYVKSMLLKYAELVQSKPGRN